MALVFYMYIVKLMLLNQAVAPQKVVIYSDSTAHINIILMVLGYLSFYMSESVFKLIN